MASITLSNGANGLKPRRYNSHTHTHAHAHAQDAILTIINPQSDVLCVAVNIVSVKYVTVFVRIRANICNLNTHLQNKNNVIYLPILM